MRKEDSELIAYIAGILAGITISLFTILLVSSYASAWPYQLNVTNGTILTFTDLNTSNLNETNLTVYIIVQNITYLNNTYQNITYLNTTCINCTQNYTYYLNGTYNATGYNKTEEDARFVLLSENNAWRSGLNYVPRGEFDTLVGRVNAINITSVDEITTVEGWSIGLSITGIVISLIAIGLLWRLSNG